MDKIRIPLAYNEDRAIIVSEEASFSAGSQYNSFIPKKTFNGEPFGLRLLKGKFLKENYEYMQLGNYITPSLLSSSFLSTLRFCLIPLKKSNLHLGK